VFGIEFHAQTDGLSAQYQYLKVYAAIVLLGIVFTLLRLVYLCANCRFVLTGKYHLSHDISFIFYIRSEWAVTGGARCSKNVFLSMVHHVMKAPLSYFETTPLGRILNRFTYDMEVIDHTLTEAMSILMIATSWFAAGVIIMLTILPWIGFALGPALFSYYLLLLHYRKSGTDLQRIDALARSPMQAIVAEGEYVFPNKMLLMRIAFSNIFRLQV
jgi:ABC-type multidrug transport system fused ATPase/permease subunit